MFHSFDKAKKKQCNNVYVIFRVVVGVLFAMHGAQKLFGMFTDRAPVELLSIMGLAGIIEFVGGIFVALGLMTTVAASISALQMLIAYLWKHAPNGLSPLGNGGEAALLFLVSFLLIAFGGPGKCAMDKLICGECAKK